MSSPVLAAGCGAVVGLGVLLIFVAARGGPARRAPVDPSRGDERVPVRTAGSIAAAATAYGVTGWLVAALAAGVAGWLTPDIVARRRRPSSLERTEAIASWAEMLRDLLAAAGGLQQAVAASATVAPAAIRREVTDLAARAQRGDLTGALRRFADDIDTPVADVLVAALALSAAHHGAHLGNALGAAAKAARAQVAMRQQVEASRSRTYTARRVVVGVTVAFAAFLFVLNRTYLEPFGTPAGQVALALIAACLAGGLLMIGRLGRFEEPVRLFRRDDR